MTLCYQLIPINAAVGTVCDIIITGTIFKYLWRSEIRRTSVIRYLVVVFVNMGALTWYAASCRARCRSFITLVSLISIIVGIVVSSRLYFSFDVQRLATAMS